MGMRISRNSILELIAATRERYCTLTKGEKGRILDEFVILSGLTRKRAISVLLHPPKIIQDRERHRKPIYGEAVRQALIVLWEASDRVCGKRLKPLAPLLIGSLERHGHLHLDPSVREHLLAISASTIDRLLAEPRLEVRKIARRRPHLKRIIRSRIPLKTFADWPEPEPGYLEIDCVAHCGGNMAGSFIHTLVLTDVASGWTECVPLVVKTADLVVDAITTIRRQVPFQLRGIDSDNGSEFINEPLVSFCSENGIEFTRGRPRQKNDQAWIEQKNSSIVRRFLGYDRFEGLQAAKSMHRLYSAIRLFVNFFQPSFKLESKWRVGAKIKKQYLAPATPCERLLASEKISEGTKTELQAMAMELDPLQLLQEIRGMQEHVSRLAGGEILPIMPHQPPDLERFLKSLATAWKEGEVRATHHKPEPPKERWWRTRKDPFEEVWPTLLEWLDASPESTTKALFKKLQEHRPGEFPEGQYRTLQRRVKEWRCAEARRLIFTGGQPGNVAQGEATD